MTDLFEQQTVPQTHGISVAYNHLAGNQVIELVQNNPNVIRQTYGLEGVRGCANGLLRELRCYAAIGSIAEVALPNFPPDATDADRIMQTQAFNWLTARFELVVFTKQKSGEWVECGVEALKNSNGSRYRLHRILDLVTDDVGALIPEWGRLGVAVRAVGYGFPQSWDRITFTGGWVQEFTWCQPKPTYVIVNNYGTSTSPSPSPTPTPAPEPTFALSLADGKTSAVANGGDSIILTITNLAAGVGVSGVWLKDNVATAVTESISTTASNIHLLPASKLANSGAGSYRLKFTYGGKEYTSNAVNVSLSAQVTTTITSTANGNTAYFVVGDNFVLDIQGRYFAPGNATYTWFRNGVALTNTGTLTIADNGSFTLNQTTSNAQFYTASGPAKEGRYKLRITQGSLTVDSNEIYGADRNPTCSLSPTTASIANTTQQITAQIAGFTVGDNLTTTWIRDNVELPATATARTYAENGGNSFSGTFFTFNTPASSFGSAPFAGAGSYKLKVSKNNTPLAVTSAAITITA